MKNNKKLRKWLDDFKLDHPLVIAGPCSAETETQMMSIANEGFKAITGEDVVDKEGNFLSKITDIVTAPARAITSIASKGLETITGGNGEEGEVKSPISDAVIQTVVSDFQTSIQEGNTLLSETINGLATSITTSNETGNKALLDKLEEVRKAVIVGALIEMDGEILTRSLTGKQEAFNRVNFASRLKS